MAVNNSTPNFSDEFLAWLIETGEVALREYLTQNGAPVALLELLEDCRLVRLLASMQKAGRLEVGEALSLPEVIARMTTDISALGGSYSGPECHYGSEQPLPWPGAEPKPAVTISQPASLGLTRSLN